jgi:RNase adapter protein RapZ
MMERIVSFGYTYGVPEHTSEDVVIDIRQLFRNPHGYPRLAGLNGLDLDVQEFIERMPNFSVLVTHLKRRASVPGVRVVYLGCTGGKHRSVFLAELLGRELQVAVEHRDLKKARRGKSR